MSSKKKCPKCGKEQIKKFSTKCSFCAASLKASDDSEIESTSGGVGERFSLNNKLLETMVILASIDGAIGESELAILIDFTFQLGKQFTGFAVRPAFESLVKEVQPLGFDEKLCRLRGNGELFRKGFSEEFNASFISDFIRMIEADGVVSSSEAKAIEVLKASTINSSKQIQSLPFEDKKNAQDEKKTIILLLIELGVCFACIDESLDLKELQIIANKAVALSSYACSESELLQMLSDSVSFIKTLSGQEIFDLISVAGKTFADWSFNDRRAIAKYVASIALVDGSVDLFELGLFNNFMCAMFPGFTKSMLIKIL